MEVDIAARPHELLNLRIKDIEFKEEGGNRYATIVVNGKTGGRPLPLIDSIPYVTRWISNHPQGSNRDALLFPNIKTDKTMQISAISSVYKRYKEYFTSLLSFENVPEDDKKKTLESLRPSSLCNYRKISSDVNLRQFAGWSISSNMHRRCASSW